MQICTYTLLQIIDLSRGISGNMTDKHIKQRYFALTTEIQVLLAYSVIRTQQSQKILENIHRYRIYTCICRLPHLGCRRKLAKIHSLKWISAKAFLSKSPCSDSKLERVPALYFLVKYRPIQQSMFSQTRASNLQQ